MACILQQCRTAFGDLPFFSIIKFKKKYIRTMKLYTFRSGVIRLSVWQTVIWEVEEEREMHELKPTISRESEKRHKHMPQILSTWKKKMMASQGNREKWKREGEGGWPWDPGRVWLRQPASCARIEWRALPMAQGIDFQAEDRLQRQGGGKGWVCCKNWPLLQPFVAGWGESCQLLCVLRLQQSAFPLSHYSG